MLTELTVSGRAMVKLPRDSHTVCRRRKRLIVSVNLTLLLLLLVNTAVSVTALAEVRDEGGGHHHEAVVSTAVSSASESVGEEITKESSSQSLEDVSDTKKERSDSDEDLSVVVLTSRNFDKSVSDGNLWLVEFFAPWCSHCRHFEPAYSEIAAYFHESGQKVRVAKVDGDSERALSTRFGVHGYPSFYLVDGWTVYSFELSRTKNNLIRFVESGYKYQEPMPFYSSPMGPLGLSQGLLMAAGLKVADHFEWLQEFFGLSPVLAGALMFGVTFMGCFCTIVFLAIVITPRHTKVD